MAEQAKKKSMYAIHFIIMVAIAFGFRLLPCPGSVTPYGMAVLGIFVSLVYGWTFIDLLIPSLFGAIAMGTTAYGSVQDVFIAMFSNTTVLMMITGIFGFMAIQMTGAGDWMVAKLLGSKLAKKSPVFVVEIFFIIFAIGMVVGLTWFLYFAMFPLMADMLLKCGYEKGNKFNFFFMAGCLMMGQVGMCIFPFMGWSLMTTGTMMQITQTMVPYNPYMLAMVLILAIMMVTYPLLMKICGCDFSKLAKVDIEAVFGGNANSKITTSQLLSIVSVIVFVVLVILSSMLSGKIGLFTWINTNIGVLGLTVVLWLFVIACKMEGKPLLETRSAAGSFSWDMTMLIAVALFISSALTSADTGISAWIAGMLTPIFIKSSPLVFLIALGVFTAILTNVSNNVALCFVMINIVCSMYLNGFPVSVFGAAIVISLTSVFVAYLTPAASLPGALLHGSPCMKSSTIYVWIWPMLVYALVVMYAVVIPMVMMGL